MAYGLDFVANEEDVVLDAEGFDLLEVCFVRDDDSNKRDEPNSLLGGNG